MAETMRNLQHMPVLTGSLQRLKTIVSNDSGNGRKILRMGAAAPELDCVCELTRRASRSVSQFYDLVLTPAHLKASQYILLRVIDDAGQIAQWMISQRLCVAVETLTRRLATMRRAGWVELRPGRDRREHLYAMTELGRSQLELARPHWQRAQQRLREQLGDVGWRQVEESLNRLADAASASASVRRKNTVPQMPKMGR
jgi:DNA-binding MarR family transcriptional regulator